SHLDAASDPFPTRRSSDLLGISPSSDRSNILGTPSDAPRDRDDRLSPAGVAAAARLPPAGPSANGRCPAARGRSRALPPPTSSRSEEHTSELQSRFDLVCR